MRPGGEGRPSQTLSPEHFCGTQGAHPSSYVHQVIQGLRQGQLAASGNKKRETSSPGQAAPSGHP